MSDELADERTAEQVLGEAIEQVMAMTHPDRVVVEWTVVAATVALEGAPQYHTRSLLRMMPHHRIGLLQAGLDLMEMGEVEDGDEPDDTP